jgi:hypothetical protein
VTTASSNCCKSSFAFSALRPRPDLRLFPLPTGRATGIWGPQARTSHLGARQRFPFWVWKFASERVRLRCLSGLNPSRPRRSAFLAAVYSSRCLIRSSQPARQPQKERQCISNHGVVRWIALQRTTSRRVNSSTTRCHAASKVRRARVPFSYVPAFGCRKLPVTGGLYLHNAALVAIGRTDAEPA